MIFLTLSRQCVHFYPVTQKILYFLRESGFLRSDIFLRLQKLLLESNRQLARSVDGERRYWLRASRIPPPAGGLVLPKIALRNQGAAGN